MGSNAWIGEITLFAGNFPPRTTMFCQGTLLSIAQNTALFSILGTTYGGNGQTTFALPDLRGRVPIQQGTGPGLPTYQLGESGGTASTTLLSTNMPQHTHTATFNGSSSTLKAAQVVSTHAQAQGVASPSMLGRSVDAGGTTTPRIYAPATSTPAVNLGGLNVAGIVTNAVAGGSQPFSIMQPYLGLNFVIAVQGIFPARN